MYNVISSKERDYERRKHGEHDRQTVRQNSKNGFYDFRRLQRLGRSKVKSQGIVRGTEKGKG